MRFWWVLLAACGSDRVTVPATVVHAEVTMTTCATPCYSALELDGVCMPNADRIDDSYSQIGVVTGVDSDKISGIVEIEYAGSIAADGAQPYLAQILGPGETADVLAAGDLAHLYRIDPKLGVIDIDHTRLAAASGDMLRFEYADTVEVHTIGKPHPIAVDVYDDDVPCCSTGNPSSGALLVLALLWLTRTSASPRYRRAPRPRR